MLDANIREQLKAYLERVVRPIRIDAFLDDGEKSREMRALLDDLAALSAKITVEVAASTAGERVPSFRVGREDSDIGIRFAGIPLGHEFTSLVLALLHVGGHAPKAEAALIERIGGLRGELRFETYVSLSCRNCPDVVQALNLMAALNPAVRHVMIDGALFEDEVQSRGILAVPSVYLNGEPFGQGRMELAQIVARLDTDGAERDAEREVERLSGKPVYDLLVVGGGPAGAAAAVYAARKGIRTGIVTERFGGQVLDTLGIDNYISVVHTEGPSFARALEAHVKAYDVDVMSGQRVQALVPGELHEVKLASGAHLRARAVVLAPGARWRELGVPGEQQYRNRGVAYCPHCDGPLYKGKRVAVAGGGNSGVEAAIDLAGIAAHVTLLEFADRLRADEVLQRKLASLPNVTVITDAQITAVTGDGTRVGGLRYVDRRSGQAHELALEGLFVQIGLLPNTDWLTGTLNLSARGEIEIDARGHTSVAGVFAAGDATTVPFKQIVIAAGDGSKAALSAFEHLVRSSAPAAALPLAA